MTPPTNDMPGRSGSLRPEIEAPFLSVGRFARPRPVLHHPAPHQEVKEPDRRQTEEHPLENRLTTRLAEYVYVAMSETGEGEEIIWEIQLAPNDQSGLSVVLILWLPAGVVGEFLVGSMAFRQPPPAITAEIVSVNVRNFLTGLRAERTKLLSVAQNGHVAPPARTSGLVLP